MFIIYYFQIYHHITVFRIVVAWVQRSVSAPHDLSLNMWMGSRMIPPYEQRTNRPHRYRVGGGRGESVRADLCPMELYARPHTHGRLPVVGGSLDLLDTDLCMQRLDL